ncbi:ATP-binding protein [Lachnoclostridium sp. Marseille-P6806]|uniref:ATP-binding protein n=1 Tax=Lachnoclostridium sp. Marseille-P6806 TaxID=2364793 RepID=UPI001031317F|nr:ATP-binding protein [Lachnoclostridium sp. Marseille-P6806]
MKFIGRTQELTKLSKAFKKNAFDAFIIYGRRRIGKSELIKQALRDSDLMGIYYECKQTSEKNNIVSLLSIISEKMNMPPLGFATMEDTLHFLFQKSQIDPFILVIDEYPYLRAKTEGLDSIFQVLIDQYKDTSKMKLIICGSFVDIMRSMIEKENPLYGRMTAIELKSMDYFDTQKFYPRYSPEDKVRIFSVFGGIPYYNRQIDDSLSVRENMMNLIVEPGSRFEDEVTNYLQTEIGKIENANEVFETLAKGYSKYKDILDQSHVSSGPALADVLKRLVHMEVVVKETPINDENNRKKTSYHISDNLSLFFFRYIFRFASQRSIMNPDIFYDRYISEDFESRYVPNRFEIICRQYLIRQNKMGTIEESFERIGKYYYDLPKERKNGEFDVVTEDKNGYFFYEAKFRTKPITEQIIKKEIEQVNHSGLKAYRYGFFSRSGYDADESEDARIKLISLREMYQD